MASALDLRWQPGVDAPALGELLYAALDDFEPIAIHENDAEDGWRVFFKDSPTRDRAAAALKDAFHDRLIALEIVDVPDEDWARRTQAHLRAVRVGRIILAPPWNIPAPVASGFSPTSQLVIIIDPSTGFGTGHHETTRLCLGLLQEVDVTAGRVIDVGTGSGVLAIAAARMGAREVIALDEDPDALANAAENIARNHVDGVVSIVRAELGRFESQPGQVVTANLTGAVLQRHAAPLGGLVAAGGVLILSGFSRDESDDVLRAFGVRVGRVVYEGDWAAARLTFPEARS